MYIPSYYREQDPRRIQDFMETHNFATLVSAVNNKALVSHLPFVVEKQGDQLHLLSHLARGNPQWQSFTPDAEVTVIFREPHAYISPMHYEDRLNVPTWNYVAIHAHGHPAIIEGPEAAAAMSRIIHAVDPGYVQQYQSLPDDYLSGMMKRLVVFTILVVNLEANFKLSQDHSLADQQNIITALNKEADPYKQEIAQMMAENLKSLK
ncbi:MAG: FMN-binding negative transcriptional regulator [Bacteroidia bacterium]